MLSGQVALVTGASRGIGRAIALKLAQNGAAVIVNYVGNQVAANQVVTEVLAMGGTAIAIRADVSQSQDVKDMVAEIKEKFGRLDILVNNAGVTRDTLLLRMKEEEWEKVIATNLTGVFNCSKEALRLILKSDNGSIINLASVVGLMGNPGQCNYGAAKAGVIGFTKSFAREVAGKCIRVNAVAPGFIATDMTSVLSEEQVEKLQAQIPLGRLGTPEDVAEAVLFLALPVSRYITGQTLNVDGGIVMQ